MERVSLLFILTCSVASFQPRPSLSRGGRFVLHYHDDKAHHHTRVEPIERAEIDLDDVERARDCTEHFGECSIQELETLQSHLHRMEGMPTEFEDESELSWLEEGLALQANLLKEREIQPTEIHETSFSLYPEVPVLDRARECAEGFGKCSIKELESLQSRLHNLPMESNIFVDESEKNWLEDGLALQAKLLKKHVPTPKVAHSHAAVPLQNFQIADELHSEESPSLYPENAFVDRARECAEKFGECSVDELKTLHSSLQRMVKESKLFEDESEQTWLEDGLLLQAKLRIERPTDPKQASPWETYEKASAKQGEGPTDEISLLYPEIPLVDRARDCAENFGNCSIQEMEDSLWDLRRHRMDAKLSNIFVDESYPSYLQDDEMSWLEQGLKLQIKILHERETAHQLK